MPRRKYGRLQKVIPPVKVEKCRYCKLGWNCPIHLKKGDGQAAGDSQQPQAKK